MVRFRILERISIRSYIFVAVGMVERPFPVKTYHYQQFIDFPAVTSYICSAVNQKKEY